MSEHHVDQDYLAKRQLKKGTAGWFLLAGLGVSYVISGDFAGWNFGIGVAGWGGFAIAAVLMAVMYLTLVLSLAEMSAAIPAAGGGYSFARQVMGPSGGYLTGLAVLIEYVLAPAAIVVFIGAAVEALVGLNGPVIYATFYFIFVSIHLIGAGEALKLMMVITALAVFAILATAITLFGSFETANLFDIAPDPSIAGANEYLPFGWHGVWAALPFGMWLFLAIEGVPLAAEEAKDPATDVPRGIVGAMLFLLVTAVLVVFLLAGAVGADAIGNSPVPLVDALKHTGNTTLATTVNVLGLAGLIASFFSIIYGYSRLVFALSRAGYLPRFLSLTNERKAPVWALAIPAALGFLISLTREGDLIIAMAVVGATISYALMALSHILLRIKHPDMHRPYKTPGGVLTSSICLVLAVIALTGVYAFDPRAFNYTIVLYVIGALYYFLYSKNHLVAKTPEEEFEMLAAAENELGE
ncbi:ethanolamine permease [Pseudomonadales bacterium]|nr:ethanolamine permease [Pseudomonadales bacterium]MDG1002722.1 ethanolamine permease [Pseudomonadales bacterium]MDG1305974.1 ethanolamine permease [Pseudomonadales bacterium]MDG1834926.1 ethanolamine permease [Pseudomonadales bacterium]MDG1909584.1 ethanolamine permease [Pseudomonadales bacterium]|tara:strand:- start:1143 stop:2549 length:1407 start_codon:yes stop_codon:yes gene_type:complete